MTVSSSHNDCLMKASIKIKYPCFLPLFTRLYLCGPHNQGTAWFRPLNFGWDRIQYSLPRTNPHQKTVSTSSSLGYWYAPAGWHSSGSEWNSAHGLNQLRKFLSVSLANHNFPIILNILCNVQRLHWKILCLLSLLHIFTLAFWGWTYEKK